MNYLQQILDTTRGAQVLATYVENERIVLKHLASLDTVRHWYSQMACLVGGNAIRCLRSLPPTSGGEPLGTWRNYLDANQAVDSPETLFSLAAQAPNDETAAIGMLAARMSWPRGTEYYLSGMKAMAKSMDELGSLPFGGSFKPSVQVGGGAETSARKRVQEGIAAAKREGFVPYREDELRSFLDVLVRARFLHVCHELQVA